MSPRKIKITALSLLFVAFIGVFTLFVGTAIMRRLYPLKYTEEVYEYSAEYNLDPVLLYAIIHTESGFNPDAESSAGAQGLMQLLPSTFKWLQSKTGEDLPPEELFIPETNIRYGAYFVNRLSEQFNGETETMIAAYHAGNNRVAKWLNNSEYSDDGRTLKKIPIPETSHYVNKVTRAMRLYKRLYHIGGQINE